MCKNYGNNNFTRYTKYQFNQNFKDGKIKNNLMGFYSWLIRIAKENNTIDLPRDQISKFWNRKQSKKASANKTNYKKVNSSTISRWLLKLEKAKLLFVNRAEINNKYILNADGSLHPNFLSSKKCTTKCTDKKDIQTVEVSSVTDLENVYKNNKLNANNKDIDILSIDSCQDQPTVENFNYKSYLDKQEKVSSMNEMQRIIEQGFKIMHVRSNKIKGNVLGNVLNYATTITKNKALNYVFAAINNARDLYYKNRKEDWFGKKNNQIDSFNNYEQRSYDFDKLEPQLLGWTE